MNMIGHITLETSSAKGVLIGSFPALGSTCGKIVGMRQTERPTTTTIPQINFKRVGFLRKMSNLRRNGENFSPISYRIFYVGLPKGIIERFSVECRKTKTKPIIMANHNRLEQHNEPIRTRSRYME